MSHDCLWTACQQMINIYLKVIYRVKIILEKLPETYYNRYQDLIDRKPNIHVTRRSKVETELLTYRTAGVTHGSIDIETGDVE